MAAGVGPRWSSRLTYSLAAIGAAVGLGNVWKFPYMAGAGGGGAFVIVYLLALLFAAAPLFMAESLIGRLGRKSPPASFKAIATTANSRFPWGVFGSIALIGALLVLSFYAVIAGWTLAYVFKAAGGVFTSQNNLGVAGIFNDFTASTWGLIFWQGLFLIIVLSIVGSGLLNGTERANRIMMPGLFLLLFILLIYAAVEGDFAAGLGFLFAPDWSRISFSVVLSAVGQALFTMGVGVGGIMAYGAYVGEGVSIARATVIVVLADTLVALVAGAIIFPLAFANGLEPAQGAGLAFKTLPIAFGQMPFGNIIGMLFFVLLVFGAITSAISMMEPGVMWLMEKGRSRYQATVLWAAIAWVFGLGTVFSFNIWSDWHPLSFLPSFSQATFFHIIDHIINDYLLPVNGVAFSLFAGWVIHRRLSCSGLGFRRSITSVFWLWSVRLTVPFILLVILVGSVI